MTEKSTKNNYWTIIGQIAALISIIWIVIQMFSFFNSKDNYSINISGNHSIFKIPEHIKQDLNNYKKTLTLYQTYRERIGGKIIPMSKLLKISEDKLKDPIFRSYYELNGYRIKSKSIDYNELWIFNISNDGNNVIENLVLEVPFSGYYSTSPQVGKSENGNFKNRIKLMDLQPGYSINIYCWTKTSFPSGTYYNTLICIDHYFLFLS